MRALNNPLKIIITKPGEGSGAAKLSTDTLKYIFIYPAHASSSRTEALNHEFTRFSIFSPFDYPLNVIKLHHHQKPNCRPTVFIKCGSKAKISLDWKRYLSRTPVTLFSRHSLQKACTVFKSTNKSPQVLLLTYLLREWRPMISVTLPKTSHT